MRTDRNEPCCRIESRSKPQAIVGLRRYLVLVEDVGWCFAAADTRSPCVELEQTPRKLQDASIRRDASIGALINGGGLGAVRYVDCPKEGDGGGVKRRGFARR